VLTEVPGRCTVGEGEKMLGSVILVLAKARVAMYRYGMCTVSIGSEASK